MNFVEALEQLLAARAVLTSCQGVKSPVTEYAQEQYDNAKDVLDQLVSGIAYPRSQGEK